MLTFTSKISKKGYCLQLISPQYYGWKPKILYPFRHLGCHVSVNVITIFSNYRWWLKYKVRKTEKVCKESYIKLFACSSSKSTDSNAIKRMRSGMSYFTSYLSFIFRLRSSFSLSVLIGGGLGRGVLFSASLSSSFLRACNLGAPIIII